MKRKENVFNLDISELCSFSLGGFQQKVLIEGKKKEAPIVITLHGGPGTPIPFSVGCRGLFPAFTDEFMMVYWDQLGCGINNYVIDDSFSIDLFVRMTEDLVKNIKKKFPHNKVMLFSMSWGSILSAMLLEKDPHAVDAVIACGQIIKNVLICDEVKSVLSQSRIPEKDLKRIKQVTTNHFSAKDLQFISKALRKYTDAYQNRNSARAPVGTIIKGLLTSPDYKFKDFKAIMVNGYMKNSSLWKEIVMLDLSSCLQNVEVPYNMIQGDTDIVASTKNVQELIDSCDNPNLKYHIVANTGHMPGAEMMKAALDVLRDTSKSL